MDATPCQSSTKRGRARQASSKRDQIVPVPTRHHGMRTRSQAFRWMSLPTEIRWMILEAIAEQKNPGWGSAAAVCQEWQFILAKRNFERLNLTNFCLDDLEKLTTRSRDLVRHIVLDVQLPKYGCTKCKTLWKTGSRDTRAVPVAWSKLLRILHTWELGHRNLTLELNAHSPSDSKHWFRNCHFTSNYGPPARDKLNDSRHGWAKGRRVKGLPGTKAIMRLFAPTFNHTWWSPVPSNGGLGAITCLTIRRHLRHWVHPETMFNILISLSGLEQLIYEPWRRCELYQEHVQYMLWPDFLRNNLRFLRNSIQHLQNGIKFPESLKRLTIFEDFDENFAQILSSSPHQGLSHTLAPLTRPPPPDMGKALALRSQQLEELSVSYMVEAADFFVEALGMAQYSNSWPHLRSLALTSELLGPQLQPSSYLSVLRRAYMLTGAGMVAKRMPNLQTLVIWHGSRGNACAFIYRNTGGGIHDITLRSTWEEFELAPMAKLAWEQMASRRRDYRKLRITHEKINETINSHGDAIHYLNLPCQVLTPESLREIREEQSYWITDDGN